MKLFRTLRRLTVKEKLNIVFSAYNSLNDFSKKKVGPSALARMYNIKQSTISKLLIRFEQSGKDVNSLIVKRATGGKRISLIGSV